MRDIVSTSDAPAAIGPYSQAVKAGGSLLFTAGQIPLDPKTMEVVGATAAEQCAQVMKNLAAVLEAAGTTFERVVKTTIFLKSMGDFASVNEVYAKYFPSAPPARSTVAVAGLPKDVLVEIECVALLPSGW
ncbi:MAG: RidA family protein [Calditrichaeota bacterium]|nr:RidA family protein [Calditrichota bacterium]MCB9367916.1 RidA family protein [Calditrichota bacterium]